MRSPPDIPADLGTCYVRIARLSKTIDDLEEALSKEQIKVRKLERKLEQIDDILSQPL